jgi:hypothetical protein
MRVSLDTVQGERRRRGIQPFRPRIPNIEWTPRMIRLLGTDTDGNLATRLGIPEHAVRFKRWKMDIPSYVDYAGKLNTFAWTRDKIALLGTNLDGVIARRLGVTRSAVALKRAQLDIKSFYSQRRIRWTKEMAALLGKITDWKISSRYHISRGSVARERQKRGIPPYIDTRPVQCTPKLKPILSLPGRVISRRYNISSITVANLRRELGVPRLQRWPAKRRQKAISRR